MLLKSADDKTKRLRLLEEPQRGGDFANALPHGPARGLSRVHKSEAPARLRDDPEQRGTAARFLQWLAGISRKAAHHLKLRMDPFRC